jgi:long-chain fatty acid transport protein
MHNQMNRVFLAVAMSTVVAAAAVSARGGGIEVPMQDSRAAAQADAFTASADDAAAVFYNPACLTLSRGTQVSVGELTLFPDWQFNANDGQSESMRFISYLPHFYASSDLGTERLRVGVGVNNEFGLNESWGPGGPLRTLVDNAKLFVLNASLAAAYKLDDHLSLGVALNIYYGELNLSRSVLLAAPPAPEGDFHLRGHGFSVGATPSFLYKIDERNSIGMYYRSPFTLDLAGTSQLNAPEIGQIGPSHTDAPLNLPQSIGLGYAVRPVDRLKVEADVIWTDWHVFKGLTIQSADPHFNGQSLPADWKSGFTFRLGGQYDLTQHWALRAGYAYSQNSVPQSTFSPLVPDSNYHLISVGVGYSTDHWSLDASYEYIFREPRNIINDVNSPTVNGSWSNNIQGLMVTFSVKL